MNLIQIILELEQTYAGMLGYGFNPEGKYLTAIKEAILYLKTLLP